MRKDLVNHVDGSPKKLKRQGPSKVNPYVVAKMTNAGMSRELIAKTIGCDPATVGYHQQKLIELAGMPHLVAYREQKGHILDAVESRIVGAMMDEGKLENASLNNLAYAFRQVADVGRLERGQTTAHIGVVMGILDAVHKNPVGSPAHTSVKQAETPEVQVVDVDSTQVDPHP